jgi:hypothetical protein
MSFSGPMVRSVCHPPFAENAKGGHLYVVPSAKGCAIHPTETDLPPVPHQSM